MDLAAAYAFGLVCNHAFADGNKRTSFVVTDAFLAGNGYELPEDDEADIATWQALAAGTLGEAELAAWLRARVQPLPPIRDRYGAWEETEAPPIAASRSTTRGSGTAGSAAPGLSPPMRPWSARPR